ncbi:hypothetical protein pb186bvf_016862 [Paramecium bursaria]
MCITLICEAFCCAGMVCCKCACCCCKSCVDSTIKEKVKLTYIIMNVVMFWITVILFNYVQSIFDKFWFIIKCPANNNKCFGVSSIYRVSFTLGCFYILMILLMICKNKVSKAINEGLWLLKIILIVAGFIGSLYIKNLFFQNYANFALIISGLYMLFQIIMLIDVFYLWGQKWIRIYEESHKLNGCMACLLICTTAMLYGIAFTLNLYNFIWFYGCTVNLFTNFFTLIIIVGITAVQLLGWNPEGSLLTSSAMACYITFISYTSQASCPEKSCNLIIYRSYFGAIMSIIALVYLTFGTTDTNLLVSSPAIMDSQKLKDQDHEKQPLTRQQQLSYANKIIQEHQLEPYRGNQYIVFHFIMFINVVYMSMMFTNWGSSKITDSTGNSYKLTYMAYWIKMSTSWIASLLYVWTLIAPRIVKTRNFRTNI